jgi:hypothetical protein
VMMSFTCPCWSILKTIKPQPYLPRHYSKKKHVPSKNPHFMKLGVYAIKSASSVTATSEVPGTVVQRVLLVKAQNPN